MRDMSPEEYFRYLDRLLGMDAESMREREQRFFYEMLANFVGVTIFFIGMFSAFYASLP